MGWIAGLGGRSPSSDGAGPQSLLDHRAGGVIPSPYALCDSAGCTCLRPAGTGRPDRGPARAILHECCSPHPAWQPCRISFGDEAEGWDIYIQGSEGLRRFYPALDQARFTEFITGLSTYTPDGQFVIGPVPHLDGYLVASGCCGAGMAASGGIGLAIAELVAGRQRTLDLEPFRADRFGAVDLSSQEFRAGCAATRSAKVSG